MESWAEDGAPIAADWRGAVWYRAVFTLAQAVGEAAKANCQAALVCCEALASVALPHGYAGEVGGEADGMTKPLTKTWRCPTCNVGFMASEARDGLKVGRRCPAGHFHSYYELVRHEQGKPIRVGRGRVAEKPKAEKSAVARRRRSIDVVRGHGQFELLALLWAAAYEKVMDQLPASTSRLLVEGAMGQAYRVSQQVLQGNTSG